MRYIFPFFLFTILSMGVKAQGNGQLDEFSDFSTSFNYSFITTDGVKLSTDLYLPITSDSMMVDLPFGNETFAVQIIPRGVQLLVYDSLNGLPNPNPFQLPMVFTRTPYNKGQDDALAIIMNMLGYAYTLQDMRGRYNSEGVYFAMYSDSWKKDAYHPTKSHALDFTELTDPHNSIFHQDGRESIQFLQDSLVWAFDLDNDGVADTIDKAYNGSLAMFGASAMGNSQYQAVAAYKKDPDNNDLKAIVPIVATLEYFDGVVQHNGVFRQALITNWLSGQMEDVAVVNPNDTDVQNNIHSTFDYGNLEPDDIINLAIDQFSALPDYNGFSAMYPNYLQRCDMDASFAPVNEQGESDANGNYSRYTNMEVPAYHLSGWWDIFVDGQIDTYHQIMAHTSAPNRQLQKLVIGPWTHGTIGMDSVGDLRFPESVFDIEILYSDISDNPDNIRIDRIVESEVLSFLRQLLNYRDDAFLSEPKVLIPESNLWQPYGPYMLRIPSENFAIRFPNFINYITGHEDIMEMPVELQTADTIFAITIDIPADTAAQEPGSVPLSDPATPVIDFNMVKNIRFYVPGPVNDGVSGNENLGNYWMETNAFPLDYGVLELPYFFDFQSQAVVTTPPLEAQTPLSYLHDPENPVQTIGGGNLTLTTPIVEKTNAGPLNLANPVWAPLTMDRPDVLQFETLPFADSLCVIGYPKMKLFVSTEVDGGGHTDTDFFVRMVDVYPDGRQIYVSEGAVNGRARDYAQSIALGSPNPNADYTNLESGQIYELNFRMMPMAYTFGKDHKMKLLVSSSNYPRYQSNPNLPIESGEFFRRDVMDGQTYNFNGVEMTPRVATQKIYNAPQMPSQIILPVYLNHDVAVDEPKIHHPTVSIFPNPSRGNMHIVIDNQDYKVIKLSNMSGQNIITLENNLSNTELDITIFDPGIYLLEIYQKNMKIETLKIVILK